MSQSLTTPPPPQLAAHSPSGEKATATAAAAAAGASSGGGLNRCATLCQVATLHSCTSASSAPPPPAAPVRPPISSLQSWSQSGRWPIRWVEKKYAYYTTEELRRMLLLYDYTTLSFSSVKPSYTTYSRRPALLISIPARRGRTGDKELTVRREGAGSETTPRPPDECRRRWEPPPLRGRRSGVVHHHPRPPRRHRDPAAIRGPVAARHLADVRAHLQRGGGALAGRAGC
eukprot:7278630-Pyramimonas_sp.AAC.2